MSFLSRLTKIVNSGQSRSVVLTGNVHDLFFDKDDTSVSAEGSYVPLLQLLRSKLKAEATPGQKGITQVVCQINRPIEIVGEKSQQDLSQIWLKYHKDAKTLKDRLLESNENVVYTFEILRQITECSRRENVKNNLLVLVEAADMLLPENEFSRMSSLDRRAVSVVHDWISNPDFMNGHDTVIMISESRSNIHHRISRFPSVLVVEIPLPSRDDRYKFITYFSNSHNLTVDADKIADLTAGLSLHAIRQLLCSGEYGADNIAAKVEEYMVSQLGEGVVEFKRPTHRMSDVIGNSVVKKFLTDELIPGFLSSGTAGISGAAVGGPIGGGKTFICEAVASELGIPVIVLKNIRSKWFGETDQIFERLRRLLESFHKIVIFVDEADTMFGDVQSDHDTERRLTGKIQSMMSDPALKGRVIWFLMTARIHRLSPDIRRPGRMDLILPILDPEGDDLTEFLEWVVKDVPSSDADEMLPLKEATKGYSAASFSMLKNIITNKNCKSIPEVVEVARDLLLPDIGETREYQTLQAKINCTRKSLLFSKSSHADVDMHRDLWKKRIAELEAKGIS